MNKTAKKLTAAFVTAAVLLKLILFLFNSTFDFPFVEKLNYLNDILFFLILYAEFCLDAPPLYAKIICGVFISLASTLTVIWENMLLLFMSPFVRFVTSDGTFYEFVQDYFTHASLSVKPPYLLVTAATLIGSAALCVCLSNEIRPKISRFLHYVYEWLFSDQIKLNFTDETGYHIKDSAKILSSIPTDKGDLILCRSLKEEKYYICLGDDINTLLSESSAYLVYSRKLRCAADMMYGDADEDDDDFTFFDKEE